MTAITAGVKWNHLRGLRVVKTKESPFPLKTLFVLHVYLKSHAVRALVISLLIDGALAFRSANFEDEHSFVGPSAGFKKGLVRLWVHKNVVEHMMVLTLCPRTV